MRRATLQHRPSYTYTPQHHITIGLRVPFIHSHSHTIGKVQSPHFLFFHIFFLFFFCIHLPYYSHIKIITKKILQQVSKINFISLYKKTMIILQHCNNGPFSYKSNALPVSSDIADNCHIADSMRQIHAIHKMRSLTRIQNSTILSDVTCMTL